MAQPTQDQPNATTPSRRRWNAFVCQDCRAVFRIPSDYIGKGIVCPQCDRMLRIPSPGESIPALVQPSGDQGAIKREIMSELQQMEQMEPAREEMPASAVSTKPQATVIPANSERPAPVAPAAHDQQLRRRKKRKDRSHDAEKEWVKNPSGRVRFSRHSGYRSWWIASALLVVILVVVMIMTLQDRKKDSNTNPVAVTPSESVTHPSVVAIQSTSQALSQKKQQVTKIKSALARAKQFIATREIPEMLSLIRGGAAMQERLQTFYQKHPVHSSETHKIDETSAILLSEGKAFQVIVRDQEESARALVLIEENDVFFVDWESWVGWSEMTFEEIKQQKPLKPTEVRVVVHAESYYNFDFPTSSEKDWQSYRLVFAGESQYLYGYVRRDNPIIHQMRPVATDSNGSMVLKIHYVESGSHPTQVVIDRVVSDSWIKALPKGP